MKVFDVFSGAGGFSLGFEMAGCEIIGAIEHDKWAADTFSYNHPEAKMMLGDIESFTEEFIRDTLKVSPDIIIGGPPCQGFSVCVKNAGDPKDPRNSLFVEFVRMAKIFSPKKRPVLGRTPHPWCRSQRLFSYPTRARESLP